MYKILLTFFVILIFSTSSWAAFQISCPSEKILALNQTNKYTLHAYVNGQMVDQTINYDVPYFNQLFNATDCTISQIADTPQLSVAQQQALFNAQMTRAQQVAPIDAQIKANREAYVDALMSGDTATQKSIVTAQVALISQKAAIAKN